VPEAAEDAALDSNAVDAAADSRPWAVYLLDCHGGRSYIGISPCPQQRFEVHRAGKGAAFTRANRPEALSAVVWFENRSAAASMEARLKALARPAKLAWFRGFAATTASSPATRADGLVSLSRRRG
jgi:putative endonuclease